MTWQPIYSHNPYGVLVSGGKDELVVLVSKAYPIKVVRGDVDPGVYREVMIPVVTFVNQGEIFVQVEWESVEFLEAGTRMTFRGGGSRCIMNLCTTGEVIRRFVRHDGTIVDETEKWALTWFADV